MSIGKSEKLHKYFLFDIGLTNLKEMWKLLACQQTIFMAKLLSILVFHLNKVEFFILFRTDGLQHHLNLVRCNHGHLIFHQVQLCKYLHLDELFVMLLHLLELRLNT